MPPKRRVPPEEEEASSGTTKRQKQRRLHDFLVRSDSAGLHEAMTSSTSTTQQPKRPRMDDFDERGDSVLQVEAESSTSTVHRVNQPRMYDFLDRPSDSGRPVTVASDDPVSISPQPKVRLRRESTSELVKLLNDPKKPEYNETTVPFMVCNTKHCHGAKAIKEFMKVEERRGSIKKIFFVTCAKCRKHGNDSNKKKRQAHAKDAERTRQAIEELNQNKEIPESSLYCTRCTKWRLIVPHFQTVTPNGRPMHVNICSFCRADTAKSHEQRKNAHLAAIEAADNDDDEVPLKCKCGFSFPIADFVESRANTGVLICPACKETQRMHHDRAKGTRKTVKAEGSITGDNGMKKCSKCLHDRPRSSFMSDKETELSTCEKCRLMPWREPKNGHRLCTRCHVYLPLANFDSVEGEAKPMCKKCSLEAREEVERAIQEGKTHTHSPAITAIIADGMRAKNIALRQQYIEKHPKASKDELDQIAPLLRGPDFQDLVMRVVQDDQDTCQLCEAKGLRIQRLQDLVEGADTKRATMQRHDTRLGYMATNISLFCLTCNLLLSDLLPHDACKLLDHLFGPKDDTAPIIAPLLTAQEKTSIIALAKQKQCSADVLLAAATASQGRCALTQSTGSFKQLSSDASVVDARIPHDRLSFDRVVPGCEGGLYELDNIQVVNCYVNFAKHALPQHVFKPWLARLTKLGASRLKKNLMAAVRRAKARP